MGQALYRKYRPRSFAEAVGQEAVTKTLEEAIKSGRISHAYLFSGPRGVGKTSVARILAHEVNDLPYKDDSFHLDIIEIDAASNRRIDEIRDLREKVHIAPTTAKYKVYIIDEVHMLTKEAFNALLKTLEEPPSHCIFILATTEPDKLPDTIISRTQRFNFKPVDSDRTKDLLQNIARNEKLDITPEALVLLADYGQSSLRDSISLLDQLSAAGKKIDEQDVRELLGIPPSAAISGLIDQIQKGDTSAVLQILDQLKLQGANPAIIARQIAGDLRKMILKDNQSSTWQTSLMKDLLSVSTSTQPQEILELIVLEAASNKSTKELTSKDSENSNGKSVNTTESKQIDVPKPIIDKVSKPESTNKKGPANLDNWNKIVERVKSEAPSLYTALRLASPSLHGDELTLAFPFPLHQKKVKEANSLNLIAQIIEEIDGIKPKIVCVVDKTVVKNHAETSTKSKTEDLYGSLEPESNESLQTITNIFGSAEVLES